MSNFSMRAICLPSSLRGSLSWLVWLAMLLPMAQSVATWHGYSHAAFDASGHEEDRQSPHAAHCDLCLTAAAVSGGALLGTPPNLSVAAARNELPQAAAGSVWLAFPTLAYLSRAPPPAPR